MINLPGLVLMKLVSKTRRGAQVSKRFDRPRTPYRRVLESSEVPEDSKAEITQIYLGINPAELRRQIGRCQDRLLELVKTKEQRRKEVWTPPRTTGSHRLKGALNPKRLEDIFSEATEKRFEDILT